MRSAWLGPLIGTSLALVGCGRIGFDGGGAATGDGGGPPGDGATDGTADARPVGPGAAGTPTRVQTFGGTGNDDGYDVVVAADGTVYVTGTFTGTLTIGNSVTSAGGDDVFLASLAADGTPNWVRRMGGPGGDRGQGLALDAAGNPYVVGLFAGTADFLGQNATAAGMWDAFVVAVDTTGARRWVATAGDVGADFAYDVAVGPGGNVMVTGYYEGAVDFGAGPLPVYGTRDSFIASYTSTGALAWARGYGSAGSDAGQAITTTAAGNVISVGTMGGPIDLGGGPLGTNGSYAVELTSTGGYVWSDFGDGLLAWDVEVDPSDDRILIGARASTGVDVGTGPVTSLGGTDAYLIAVGADRVTAWTQAYGGTLDDLGLGLTLDAAGNVYTVGLGGPTLTLGGTVADVPGNGGQDVFVAAHDLTGAPRWGRMLGGAGQDRGYGIAVAPDGAVYVTGRFAGTAELGLGPATSAGGDDIMLVRIE